MFNVEGPRMPFHDIGLCPWWEVYDLTFFRRTAVHPHMRSCADMQVMMRIAETDVAPMRGMLFLAVIDTMIALICSFLGTSIS